MSTLKESGPWTPNMFAKHLPEENAFDEGLIRAIMDFYKPVKCLDLGCGLGFYVRYMREQGVDAWGVEAEDLKDLFKSPGHQIKQDLRQPFDLKEKYDLVLCLEVVEHIPREFEETVFDNILRHMKKYLLFSGATPGQHGTGHVNERHESYWFSQLVRRGLALLHQVSTKHRMSCTLPWYAKNISVWELVHPNEYHLPDLIAEKYSEILSYELKLRQMQYQQFWIM